MAKLRSQGETQVLKRVAQRSMGYTYVSYVAFVCAVGWALSVLSSYNPKFGLAGNDNLRLWFLLAITIFVERYGALHMQLFSTTNRIVWHIANGISGLLIISYLLILPPIFGVLGFPLSFLLGYACFFCWYSASLSYRSVGETLWNFEKETLLLPCALFLGTNFIVETII